MDGATELSARRSCSAGFQPVFFFTPPKAKTPPRWRRYKSCSADRAQVAKHVCRAEHVGLKVRASTEKRRYSACSPEAQRRSKRGPSTASRARRNHGQGKGARDSAQDNDTRLRRRVCRARWCYDARDAWQHIWGFGIARGTGGRGFRERSRGHRAGRWCGASRAAVAAAAGDGAGGSGDAAGVCDRAGRAVPFYSVARRVWDAA